MQRLDVLLPLRARRPLQVAEAEVGDAVGAADALLVLRAAVALLAHAAGHAAGVLHALLVRAADAVEARVWKPISYFICYCNDLTEQSPVHDAAFRSGKNRKKGC